MADYSHVIEDSIERATERKVIPRDKSISKTSVNKIITILGPRRAGKTYYLYQIIQNLQKENLQFLYLNFEDERLILKTEDLDKLMTQSHALLGDFTHIFFDEIQNVRVWVPFVRRLQEAGYKLFLTGSSSKLLSKEIATALRGRTLSTEMFPFSFYEILNAKDVSLKKRLTTKQHAHVLSHFSNYLEFGGYPEVFLESDETLKIEYLSDYLEVMLFRDVVERHNIRNVKLARLVLKLLLASYTKEISFRKITEAAKQIDPKAGKDAVIAYAQHFADSFMLFYLNRFSFSQYTTERTKPKVYVIDGFPQLVLSNSNDKGKKLENTVFLELRKSGLKENKDMFYFKSQAGNEVDFIIKKKTKITTLIQVCYEVTEDNKMRELKGFSDCISSLKLHNPQCLLLTYNQSDTLSYNDQQIDVMPAWKYVLELRKGN